MAIPMANGETVAPFDRVTDVNVIMTIVHPQPIVGLGNMLILNKVTEPATLAPAADDSVSPADAGTTGNSASGKTTGVDSTGTKTPATPAGRAFSNSLSNKDRMNGILKRKVDEKTGALYREYRNLDAVEVDYPEGTQIYKEAEGYFAQANHSDRVAVLDYVDGKIEDSLKDFWYFNWTFAIYPQNKFDDETVLLSNIFEANQDHFLVMQSNDLAKFEKFYGQNYTIGLKHDENEPMDSAFIGAVATKPVGSTTWKFKTLNGITPEDLTTQEKSGLDTTHAIGYIYSDGSPQTSEGFTLSGEFIDLLHGEIWVKTTMGHRLERLLKDNDKIPYNATGISMLQATATSVLEEAFQMGIVQVKESNGKGDYTVTATPRSAQSRDDLSKRHYGGLSFTYHASSAIHTLTVNGVVQSDTILN